MKHLPDSISLVAEWAELTPLQRAALSDTGLLRHHEHFADLRRAADVGLAETAALIAHALAPPSSATTAWPNAPAHAPRNC